MTTDDNPYAALEALEVKARTSRNHRTTHLFEKQRALIVEQDAAVRDPHYRGGAVFEFWYAYRIGSGERYITRVEAQNLLDGYEPEPPAPFDEAAFIARAAQPSSLQSMLDRPTTYTQPDPVTVVGDRSPQGRDEARAAALLQLALKGEDPAWWDVRARHRNDVWTCSFERRIRRRE